MLDKYDSANEFTQEISKSMKLHILGMWQNANEFIRKLANKQTEKNRQPALSVTCNYRLELN